MHVLFIDLDRFKLVNDSLGHAAGDQLLVEAAGRLGILVRPGDVVARIGGDEFVIALFGVDGAGAERVADRILAAMRVPVDVDGHRLFSSASIGVTSSRTSPREISACLRDADVALYAAKNAGRDQVAWFDEESRRASVERLRTETDLRLALDRGELVLHYQASYDLVSGCPNGVEALMRWQHPQRGLVPPGEFIPVAEDSGLIAPMGQWALGEAARAARRWLDAGEPVPVWVNVSGRQLRGPGLAGIVATVLAETGLPAALFGIEVTESVLAHSEAGPAELAALRAMGVGVAIDDFGTGYSSLGRLRDLPLDVLKIDRSFVADLDAEDGQARAVVAAVVELGHAIGASTIAEGVETEGQLRRLQAMGCDAACGFLLARPVPEADLCEAVRRGSELVLPEAARTVVR